MLYTRKGDLGDTGLFGCDQRISKSSKIAEALGTLDELNSFLGICKVKSATFGESAASQGWNFVEILESVQQNLFTIQAEVAGADKYLNEQSIREIEELIDKAERELPPIKSFLLAGGTELSANFDFGRTIARRAERRTVEVLDESRISLGEHTLPYLNRLSSLLYAMARLSNVFSGINDKSPKY